MGVLSPLWGSPQSQLLLGYTSFTQVFPGWFCVHFLGLAGVTVMVSISCPSYFLIFSHSSGYTCFLLGSVALLQWVGYWGYPHS